MEKRRCLKFCSCIGGEIDRIVSPSWVVSLRSDVEKLIGSDSGSGKPSANDRRCICSLALLSIGTVVRWSPAQKLWRRKSTSSLEGARRRRRCMFTKTNHRVGLASARHYKPDDTGNLAKWYVDKRFLRSQAMRTSPKQIRRLR